MFIRKDTGKSGKKYCVFFTAAEADSTTPELFARFDSLSEAAMVFRYLNGGTLTNEAMQKVDAALNNSTH